MADALMLFAGVGLSVRRGEVETEGAEDRDSEGDGVTVEVRGVAVSLCGTVWDIVGVVALQDSDSERVAEGVEEPVRDGMGVTDEVEE